MIGRSNARRGARRIFTVLQNRRLNQHIAYIIMDEARFTSLPNSVNYRHILDVRCALPGNQRQHYMIHAMSISNSDYLLLEPFYLCLWGVHFRLWGFCFFFCVPLA